MSWNNVLPAWLFGATINTEKKDNNMARIVLINEIAGVGYSPAFELRNNGEVVGTYSRARDAKRGAIRRGLTVA